MGYSFFLGNAFPEPRRLSLFFLVWKFHGSNSIILLDSRVNFFPLPARDRTTFKGRIVVSVVGFKKDTPLGASAFPAKVLLRLVARFGRFSTPPLVSPSLVSSSPDYIIGTAVRSEPARISWRFCLSFFCRLSFLWSGRPSHCPNRSIRRPSLLSGQENAIRSSNFALFLVLITICC